MVGDANSCEVGACCNTDGKFNGVFGLLGGKIEVCCIVGSCGCICSFGPPITPGEISSFVLRPRFFGVVVCLLFAPTNCAVYIDGGISGIVSCDVDNGNGDTNAGIVDCIITLDPVSMVSFVGESSLIFIGSVNASFSFRLRIVSPANFN